LTDPWQSPLHAFFVLLGTVVAVVMFVRSARGGQALDFRLLTLLAGALLGGALGSKAAVLWRYLDRDATPSLLGWLIVGGQSVLGGLSGAYLGVVLSKRLTGYRAGTGDLFAPAAALGIGVGRIGCLLTETPGSPTGAAFGVVVDRTRAAQIPGFPPAWIGLPLHPSFAYEIAFQFAIAAWLVGLRARGAYRGDLFKLYCLTYAPFRFLIEFVRGNPAVWHGLTRSQLFLLPVMPLLILLFLRRQRRLPLPPFPHSFDQPADA
jgi:phosphatidylglycerol:prolipoprotein diacylglycerol transferase